jgi:hypothetical protein
MIALSSAGILEYKSSHEGACVSGLPISSMISRILSLGKIFVRDILSIRNAMQSVLAVRPIDAEDLSV